MSPLRMPDLHGFTLHKGKTLQVGSVLRNFPDPRRLLLSLAQRLGEVELMQAVLLHIVYWPRLTWPKADRSTQETIVPSPIFLARRPGGGLLTKHFVS